MRKKWIPGVTGAALALTFASPALVLAQQSPQQMPSFQQADQDGDGNITQSEAQSALGLDQQQFQRVDDNADSQLDPAEYEIAVNLAEQQRQMGQTPTEEQPAVAQAQPEGGGDLMQMRASEIAGKELVNQQGEQLGDVDRIVRSNQDDKLYAVISMGGFFGIGGQEVVLPVEELQLQQDQLTVSMSKSQLEQQQKFSEQQYQEVESEQQLAQLQQQPGQQPQPAAGATGQQQTQEVRLSFQDLDADKNGSISQDELQQAFQQADQNQDGSLDQSEFSALETVELQQGQQPSGQMQQQQQPGQQQVAISFEDLDRNGDGYVDRNEAQNLQDLTQSWQQWDNNGDDQLDKTEFSAFESSAVTGQQPPGQQQQPMAGATGQQQQQEIRLSFQSLDADNNGSISQDEVQQAFQQADQNRDGSLDQSEFSALETVELQPGGQQQMQDQQQQQEPMMQQPGMQEETTGQMGQQQETPRVAISFQDLDQDSDGYISRDEAQNLQDLTQNWQQWDNNGDDQLDRAEFSAFESEAVTDQQEMPGALPPSPGAVQQEQQQMEQQEQQPQGEPLFGQ